VIINLPSTFVIGGVHTNLHWLIDFFLKHPEICSGKSIGANFFANDKLYKNGISELYKEFIHAESNKVKVEIAPNYLFYGEKVIPRIKALYNNDIKDLKFIVYLEDPLERMINEYQFNSEQGIETLSLGNALLREEKLLAMPEYYSSGNTCGLYSTNSMYAAQLKIWMSEFDANQFLYIDESDKMKASVSNFLGVMAKENQSLTNSDLGQKTVKLLSSYFKSKQVKDRQSILKTIPNGLFAKLEEDIQKLEHITDLDFSYWKSRGMAVI
jgi:hypothetical protein